MNKMTRRPPKNPFPIHDLANVNSYCPELYALEYGDRVVDIPFYVDHATRSGGPVLELGCGAGRITIPIAEAGVEVHGMDNSGDMLIELSLKLDGKLPLGIIARNVVEEDWRDVSALPFPLVIAPFNLLTHIHDTKDVRDLLDRVRFMLAFEGRFVFDVSIPHPILYATRTEEDCYGQEVRNTGLDARGLPIYKLTHEEGWYDPIESIRYVRYVYEDAVDMTPEQMESATPDDLFPSDGAEERRRSLEFLLRLRTVSEWRLLLDWCGFEVVAEWGGFSGEELTGESIRYVVECRVADKGGDA